MTGVRSGGCGTCRTRKVKCDGVRPVCQRCTKANIDCQGYLKPVIFVDERIRMTKAEHIDNAQQQEFSGYLKKGQAIYRSNPTNIEHRRLTNISPKELPFGAFGDNIFISFLLSRLFDGSNKFQSNGWWLVNALKSKTASMSLHALATMFYGRSHGQADIIARGVKRYTEALPCLRNDILGPVALSFGTLASTTALGMYEVGLSSLFYDEWLESLVDCIERSE